MKIMKGRNVEMWFEAYNYSVPPFKLIDFPGRETKLLNTIKEASARP